MSWLNLPASQSTDWSQVDFLNQFVDAMTERADVVGYALTISKSAVGDDVQAATFIAGLQQQLETLAVKYYDPNLIDIPSLTSSSYISNYLFTLANWRSAAGINANGFTRKYPDGNGGVTTAYGQIQGGDDIGPWIWNELQAGIQTLAHFLVDLTGQGITYDGYYSNVSGYYSTYSDAESAADAAFGPGDAPYNPNTRGTVMARQGTNSYEGQQISIDNIEPVLSRSRNFNQTISATVDMWLYCGLILSNPPAYLTQVFDGQGISGVTTPDAFNEVANYLMEAPASNGVWVLSAGQTPAGSSSLSTWAADPADPTGSSYPSYVTNRGFAWGSAVGHVHDFNWTYP